MMSCGQTNAFLPTVNLIINCKGENSSNYRKFDPNCMGNGNLKSGNKVLPRLACNALNDTRFDFVCKAKGNANRENEGFSWESLKNAMGGIGKEESVQDWVKKQMRENELGGDGGDGGRPGGQGGGGSGGDEDEGFVGILDELLQVILATIGFILVYVYLIRGAELTRLARDYIKYLFGASPSMRLTKAMNKWRKFIASITVTVDTREDWLERAIVATPTWWHNPRKLASLVNSRDEY